MDGLEGRPERHHVRGKKRIATTTIVGIKSRLRGKMKLAIRGLYAFLGGCALLLLIPARLGGQSQGGGAVVEEIVVRVNNQIITLSDYQKGEADLQHDVAQECPKCPQATLDAEYKDREKNLLRDMI